MPLSEITPKRPHWEPNENPDDIVVPGLDKSEPVNDQVEYIDQAITKHLQNIDANLAKACHIMTTRMLPAIKRFAVSTEPVREAAKFWTTFYEEAAQVRIPISDDLTEVHDMEDESHIGDTTDATETQNSLSESVEPSNESFMPGIAALSSTPALPSRHDTIGQAPELDNASTWSASMESPLIRLDRQLQSFSTYEIASSSNEMLDKTNGALIQQPVSPKGKEKQQSQPLLRSAILQSQTAKIQSSHVSPLKFKLKPKPTMPEHLQQFIAPESSNVTLPGTPQRAKKFQRSPRKQSPHKSARLSTRHDPYDDSFDDPAEMFGGMSPPVKVTIPAQDTTTAIRSYPKLGQTPRKEAADKIMKDLINYPRGYTARIPAPNSQNRAESSISTDTSLASLSRYNRPAFKATEEEEGSTMGVDSTLDSVLHRVSQSVLPLNAREGGLIAQSTSRSQNAKTPDKQRYDNLFMVNDDTEHALPECQYGQNDDHSDSSSDSFSDLRDGNNEPPAFQQTHLGPDDSFGSSDRSSVDSFDDEVDPNFHPNAHYAVPPREIDLAEDSFDDEDDDDSHFARPEEETVFGRPPAQRYGAVSEQNRTNHLRIHGEMSDDTEAIAQRMAALTSPTPFANNQAR